VLPFFKMDLTETGCKDVEWIYLAQGTVQWQAAIFQEAEEASPT
jgi:hypothetical protein